jgi:protein-S-isoprenylcysteine O-methyltransferase Ste14
MTMTVPVVVVWAAFGLYWLIAAARAKEGAPGRRPSPPGLLILAAFALARVFKTGTLAVHSPILQAVGMTLLLWGVGLAVWARIHLGRNWGMPMSRKEDPELVTSGPYRLVRHPIYSGILLGLLGTALATNLYWLIAVAVIGPYFLYSGRVEERLLSSSFPAAYPGYRARTKMLIPFVV